MKESNFSENTQPEALLEHVCYSYPDSTAPAVSDVSLRVEKGEFLAILGRNGSGKSTLAKLLNALYIPSSGTVRICGIDASNEENAWDVRSHCGMVFQNPDNQIVSTIVEEDVAFGLENLGVESAEIRRRVDEALRIVGLSEHAQSAPHMLSGGQKQRVAIAGVLAMRCDVIVFDEATAMLDPSGRSEIFEIVRRLNREEGITVVWITHFMEEAVQADRVCIMDGGCIRTEGTPRDVFSHSEELRALGLDVPTATRFAHALGLPEGILTIQEAVDAICR